MDLVTVKLRMHREHKFKMKRTRIKTREKSDTQVVSDITYEVFGGEM